MTMAQSGMFRHGDSRMKIDLTPDQARVFLGYIDTTLKARGIEALDSAWLFKSKIEQAAREEQNEQKISPFNPPAASDAASQLG